MKNIAAHTIITAHNNADFDALAAIIAASRLYPGAVLVFPGSQEKNLRNFFIQSATYMFDFQNAKDIDMASVQRLVVVDTRQRSRLSHIQALLDKPGLEVHVYDHHPDAAEPGEDLVPIAGKVLPWGAATTVLVHEIMARGLDVTPDEATILGLGIYEDTGSFTFASTVGQDFEAAAWLKARGMDQNVIADLLTRDLTSQQITILNTLLESAATHNINGVEVVLAEASTDVYMSDFALLAHKLLDMENIRVLFALGRMVDRIHIVARSRSAEVDVGQICTSLGGGGHAFAASASVNDRTLAQVKDELFALLYSHINPQILVRSIMTAPPVVVEAEDTIQHAVDTMGRYSLKALPVVAAGGMQCRGVLEAQIASKALSHGLGQVKVKEYMNRDCAVAAPDSDLYPVMETIMGQRQGLVPVVRDGNVIGVISRTDIINTLIEEPARIPERLVPEKGRERNIRALLRERLPRDVLALLELAGDLGEQWGCAVYAVGGFVRDILLYRPNLDLDLVVEGDGIGFARALADQLGGRVRAHHKFKTAVVIFDRGQGRERIDVATARLEYYEYPAALPTVELSSIKMDLYRRDFTVNALAVQLNPNHYGRLVDFFGAQRDIKDRVIRVLHSLSFVEDPTRILRAVRFEQRYNFSIGGQTERLIKNALHLGLMEKLSGSRLFHEIRLIMDEEQPMACLRRMHQLGLMRAIHPILTLTRSKETVLHEAERVVNWHRLLYQEERPEVWQIYLLGLCSGSSPDDTASLLRRLYFTPRMVQDFASLREQVFLAGRKLIFWSRRKNPALSELYHILAPVPVEGVLYLMARSRKEESRRHISLFLTRLKGERVAITGDDLVRRLGMAPGPAVGNLLRAVLDASIDGIAPSRETQLSYAAKLLAQGWETA
ncbi:MAG: CBS domain-containing protein [Desulfovibrionaceae bacterium]